MNEKETTQLVGTALKLANMRSAVAVMDGWVNKTTGYGIQGFDKTTDFDFNRRNFLDREKLEALYTDNDLVGTIVDRPVDDALRQGYGLDFDGASEDPEKVHDIIMWAETTYDVTQELVFALRAARLFGGGGVVYGIDDGRDLEEPAREKSPIMFLRSVDKPEFYALYWNADPSQQDFGTPATYSWTIPSYVPGRPGEKTQPKQVLVDESRVEPFYGVLSTKRNWIEQRGWGDSVLRRVIDVLTKFDTAWGSIMTLLQDASQGVYKIKGLEEALTSDNIELLQERFQLINLGKSAFKAIALDADGEEYTRIATPLTEMSDVIEKAMLRVASAARMPVTILFGDSPSGIVGEGGGETRNYYDTVKTRQTFDIGPALTRIYTRLLAQPGSPTGGVVPKNLKVWFPSLWQMTPKEEAALYQMQAQADASNVNARILSPEEIAIHRAHQTTPHGFPRINIDQRRELLEMQREAGVMLGPVEPMEPADPNQNQNENEEGSPNDDDATPPDGQEPEDNPNT